MISLVQATELTREFLKKSSIVCGVLLSLFIIYQIGLFIYKVFIPPPPAPAEEKFGLLPPVKFPSPLQSISYTLNTPTGRLPTFVDRMKVYKIKQRGAQLLDLNNIRGRLQGAGFTKNELKQSEIIYQWTSITQPETFIRLNIVSNAFEIHSNFYNDPYVLANIRFPKTNTAIQNTALTLLSSIGENISSFDLAKTNYTYFKLVDGKLIQVDALNDAKIAKVDLYQKSIDKLSINYPSFNNESIDRFWIGSSRNYPIIVYGNFRHQETDITDPSYSSMYLMKNSSQAFSDLKSGKAFVFNPSNRTNVEITDVSMGYYIGELDLSVLEQEYIIPIFIFTGRDFKAYVHALPDSKFLSAGR